MKHYFLLLTLVICSKVIGQWEHTNIPNTQIKCIAVQGDTVLVGTAGCGIHLSFDAADSWYTNDCSGSPFPYIWSVMIDGPDLYAATMSGLYRSSDGGNTWLAISNGLVGGLQDTIVLDVIRDGPYLFAALTTGVFRSSDNGLNWNAVNTGFEGGARTLTKHGSFLFAGSLGAGVFRTADNGNNWTAVNTGLTNALVTDLISVGSELYLSTQYGVFSSSDSGSSWSEITNGMINSHINALLSVNSHLIAASAGGGVYVSTNNGLFWTTYNSGLTNLTMTSLAMNNTYVFAGCHHNGALPGDVMRQEISMLTSVEELAEPYPISIYPSLTSGQVNIDDRNAGLMDRTVHVLDASGRELKNVRIGKESLSQFSLDGSAGLYIVEVRTAAGRIAYFRVVKH
jgi:photosystem II stability/assembly factor-like uncharacterized protein